MPASQPSLAGRSLATSKHEASASPVFRHAPTSFDPCATGLGRLGCLRLVFVVGGTATRNGIVGARAQIHIDVVEVAHHIYVRRERRHDLVVGGVNIFATVGYDFVELDVAERLQ